MCPLSDASGATRSLPFYGPGVDDSVDVARVPLVTAGGAPHDQVPDALGRRVDIADLFDSERRGVDVDGVLELRAPKAAVRQELRRRDDLDRVGVLVDEVVDRDDLVAERRERVLVVL